MKSIEDRLVRYKDQEELSRIVSSVLNWSPGTPLRRIANSHSSPHLDYGPPDQIVDIVKNLPKEHEVVKELIRQSKGFLENILVKSKEEIKNEIKEYPQYRYFTPFTSVVAIGKYEELFEDAKKAAYHLINFNLLEEGSQPPMDNLIYHDVFGAITAYRESHKEDVRKFLGYLREKKIGHALMISEYSDMKDETAIDAFIEIFEEAKGKDQFILNGIQKDIDFDFIGKRRLRRNFPNYDFKTRCEQIKDENLRSKLEKILL